MNGIIEQNDGYFDTTFLRSLPSYIAQASEALDTAYAFHEDGRLVQTVHETMTQFMANQPLTDDFSVKNLDQITHFLTRFSSSLYTKLDIQSIQTVVNQNPSDVSNSYHGTFSHKIALNPFDMRSWNDAIINTSHETVHAYQNRRVRNVLGQSLRIWKVS